MATIEQKKQERQDIEAVRFISSAFLEISATRMQALRSQIEENKQYYREIGNVYAVVKQSALADRPAEQTGPSGKVTTVSVAFTSNKRFYGTINQDVIKTFLSRTEGMHTDRIVIGTTGQGIVGHLKDASRYQFHAFKKDQPSVEEMRAFLKRVLPYKQIFIYYPTFTSVFRQEIQSLDITYTPAAADQTERVGYIFEPELPMILDFFEHRVRFLLFQRAMLETELARVAARFVAMTSAEQNSEDSVRRLTNAITQLENASANRQLLESLIGFAKWKEQ